MKWLRPYTLAPEIPLQKNEKLGLELRNPNANEYTGLFIEKILQNSAAQMVSKDTCIFVKNHKKIITSHTSQA